MSAQGCPALLHKPFINTSLGKLEIFLQKNATKRRYLVSGREASGNAARGNGHRRTRCLQLPHVALPNATRGNRRNFVRDLTAAHAGPILSLLCGSKCSFVTN